MSLPKKCAAKLLKNFETILKESGVQYTVLTQENIGLGGAIQTGLLHAHGDFLCWADPDDFLLPGSVEKRATYLLQHPACGAVSSDAFVFDESNLETPLYREAARFSHRFELMQFLVSSARRRHGVRRLPHDPHALF